MSGDRHSSDPRYERLDIRGTTPGTITPPGTPSTPSVSPADHRVDSLDDMFRTVGEVPGEARTEAPSDDTMPTGGGGDRDA